MDSKKEQTTSLTPGKLPRPPLTLGLEQALLEEEIANGTRLMNIVIVDLNKREIQLKMVQYEMVLELREFLTEHVYTCFFTHYYFEH